MTADAAQPDLRSALRAALRDAMKAREREVVEAIRIVLAALDNAEAVDASAGPVGDVHSEHVAGTAGGLGAGEVARATLTAADVASVVEAEIAELRAAADESARHGQPDHAARLARQADALARVAAGAAPAA